MITLQNSKLNEKENAFKKSYEALTANEKFMYEGFSCEKINDKYFFAENAYGRYIIFDVFENCGSIGAYGVTEYSTIDEVYNRIASLEGAREHIH